MSVVETTCDACGTTVGHGEYYCKSCRLEKKASPDRSPLGLKFFSGLLILNAISHLPQILAAISIDTVNVTVTAGFFGALILTELVFAYGFWTLRSWAYNGGMVVLTVWLAITFFTGIWLTTITLALVIPYIVGKRRLFKR